MRISVVGLGKLGAPLAAVLADHGHEVVGVDSRPEVVALVNASHAPVEEPGLAELIAHNQARIRATTDAEAAAVDTDLSFIIVPTPSLPSGLFSTSFVLDTVEALGRGLRRKTGYHVIVVVSTVAPLTMEGQIAPALERASGRMVGDSVGLCYGPEFIALGTVIRDMCHPDFVLIGQSDARAGDLLETVQRTVVGEKTDIRRMSLVNAEIAKLAVNTFVTTKISYANMLGEICERLPGGDVEVVTDALGLDTRIGRRFFKGAVGYGGPCFPRDNAAFVAVARQCGTNADIAAATDAVNRRQIDRLASLVKSHVEGMDRQVAVLGLSYKPNTNVVEESQGVMLANRLAADGYMVTVFDPVALDQAAPVLERSIGRARSLEECLQSAALAVITVPWPEFRKIPSLLTAQPPKHRVVIDCWRLLDRTRLEGIAEVVCIGTGVVAGSLTADSPAAFTRK
jgi:UDPglucose 6-dehydrogenase